MQVNKRFLSPEASDFGGGDYGYASDEVKTSPFNFGLNAGAAKLVKFEWIPNGGKDGAEQEALDIVFEINGVQKNYRKFPLSKVYDKQGTELTDVNSKEYQEAKKEAQTDFNATITHIMHSFVKDEDYKPAMQRPFKSFKEFAQHVASLLPKNFQEILLDIFLQYQWQPSEGQTRTYLEIPKKMKYGAWLKPAQPGTWSEKRADNITEATRKALWYVNENGDEHPFVKNGWFMLSPFANPVRGEGSEASGDNSGAAAMNAGTSTAPSDAPPASAW